MAVRQSVLDALSEFARLSSGSQSSWASLLDQFALERFCRRQHLSLSVQKQYLRALEPATEESANEHP